VPAHLVQGCEGFVAPPLAQAEKDLHERMRKARNKDKTIVISGQEYKIASDLALKGRPCSQGICCEALRIARLLMVRSLNPKTSETETPPEWIWLPNALVDGVGVETPPIEIARESGRPAALHLPLDLYAAQSLAENGGVHWRRLRLSYERERVGQQGIYVVWGFTKKTKETWGSVPFVEAHMTPGKDREAGFKTFWEALEILTLAGLVEFVGHVIDHDHDEGTVIHPYSWPNGEPAERELVYAGHHAALRICWRTGKRIR